MIVFLGLRFMLSNWFDNINTTSTDLILSGIVVILFLTHFFTKKATCYKILLTKSKEEQKQPL